MFKKFGIILITTLTLTFNVFASSDGELLLKKNEPSEVKDCFESFNRGSFAFNQALDGLVVKPVASVYKKLPSPVKTGVSNSLDNLSNLVTVPNNLLQGDFSLAGVNTGRFLINSTVGLLGLVDVAQHVGMKEWHQKCLCVNRLIVNLFLDENETVATHSLPCFCVRTVDFLWFCTPAGRS